MGDSFVKVLRLTDIYDSTISIIIPINPGFVGEKRYFLFYCHYRTTKLNKNEDDAKAINANASFNIVSKGMLKIISHILQLQLQYLSP